MTQPEMMQHSGRTAIVVGAGISGLSTAIGLERQGWQVTVLERSPVLREAGAGMSLMANARHCLAALGVADAARALSAVMLPGGEGVRTPSGRRLIAGPDPDFVAEHDLTAIVLLRPQLQKLLAARLPAGCVRTGAEVTGIVVTGERPVVSYRTPSGSRTVRADLVVGADGVNSTVRAAVWPDAAPPVYSGHNVFRGVTADPFTETGGNTWGRGLQFGRMPLADGRVYWYAVAETPPFQRFAENKAQVRRLFGRWHEPIPSIIESTPDGTVLHHDVFDMEAGLSSYVSGRVALVGDAAHAMTSDIGQGACQALEDAVVLCAELGACGDVEAALSRYDAQRRPRSQLIAAASRGMGRMTMITGRWGVLLRNLTVRMASPEVSRRRLVEIGGWQPPALGEERAAA